MTGEQIKALRKKHNYSQVKLADKVGVVHSTISAWEREELDINKKYIRRIRCAFGLPITQKERADKLEERKEIREVLADIGNESIAKMDDNDPRLIRLQKAMGA